MKTIKKKFPALSLLSICVALFSFSSPSGGEGFEIYLNNHLVVQQFGKDMNNVKSLPLDANSYNGQLSVKYYHCGKVGKNREITIRDEHNNLLKEWRFTDGSDATMNCPVNEILGLQKTKNSNALNLYYSSIELSKERLLVTIVKTYNGQTKP